MMKKTIVSLVIVIIIGLFGWRIYSKIQQKKVVNERRGMRTVAVEVKPVINKDIKDISEFAGTLLPRSKFIVSPKIAGRLDKLMVNIGDKIKSGTPIASLDDAEYKQAVAESEAALQVSRASLAESKSALEVAERDYNRAKELFEQKVASESERDEAEARYLAAKAKYDVAEAQIKQREASYEAAKVRLSYTQINAVWDDKDKERIIAERFVDEGAMLRANDPIVSIVDQQSVLAVIYVIEKDFPKIKINQPATVMTDAYPGKKFDGIIIRYSPVLKEESRQARVEIDIPNPEGLLAAGMFVRCSIVFAEHKGAIAVPVTALTRREGKQGVFLIDEQKMEARFIPVTTGVTEDNYIEILEPEIAGNVVTIGHHLLENGSKVVIPEFRTAENTKIPNPSKKELQKDSSEKGNK